VATPTDVVAEARAAIATGGLAALTIDDLTDADLDAIAWSGEPRHRVAVSDALARVTSGEVEYLAVRTPGGRPVAKVGIDYARYDGGGYLWQFATHPELQGQGIGTHLMAGAEARIRRRGLSVARINVEFDNEGARALYARLGYEVIGNDIEVWQRDDGAGGTVMHRAEVALLRKPLS
jgi:ribosomal protein S18 acetylase RimI-like enzyme